MPVTIDDEKCAFAEWFKSTFKVAVWFDGNELCIPPRSGRSVPAIAHVAWAAWNKRASQSAIKYLLENWNMKDKQEFSNFLPKAFHKRGGAHTDVIRKRY